MEEEINELNKNLNKWHIENTGLIIVHPFLSQLFKFVEFLNNENQFLNEELQYRAVYLLHFLATGQNSNINEVDLAMSKVLCGMRIEDPIASNLDLLPKEKDTAIELLNVLIDRWEKLGNTSIEGLQNTFLNRTGMLEEKDGAYQLAVESSGTDILLDFLQWDISMVKLPWVKQIIYTSWR